MRPDVTALFLMDAPWSRILPCTGYFVLRGGNASLAFVKRWWDTDSPATNLQHNFEQSALYALLNDDSTCRSRVQVLDEWQFKIAAFDQTIFHDPRRRPDLLREVLVENGWAADDASVVSILRTVEVLRINPADEAQSISDYSTKYRVEC